MRVRIAILTCLLMASLPLPCMAEAASARVAFLGVAPPADPTRERAWQAFAGGLQALGWTEGKNITFIRRYSEGRADRATALAAELIAGQPDVIVVVTYPNAKAVQQGTKTIPMVFMNLADPVGLGLVASLARPGGNITGTSGQAEDIIGKGLQLIKETRPGISRVAFLAYGEPAYWTRTQQIATAAAEYLGLGLTMIPIKSAADFDTAFAQIKRERPDAVVVSSIPLFAEHGKEIAAFALDQRLPSFTFSEAMARDGLLLAQSADIVGAYRPAAAMVDKILKGAKPADIPVEQPTRFHFVVNLKTARAIGVEIPPALLANADEVIE
jgi:putative tryptophan/tyrosine transport system substrate-binding protein